MIVPLARVEVLHFRHALSEPVPTGMGPLEHRPAILVRIEDDDGAAGWGEIWCNFPPGGDLHRARLAAQVAEVALAALDPELPVFLQVLKRLHRLAIQAGEPGPVAQIACGFDIALTDLAARRAGQPLARHLGGDLRPLNAYASGVSPDKAGSQIADMRARGYRTFKQRIGFGRDDSLAEAEETASALGAGERLMLDANQAWETDAARRKCERLAPLNLVWMEEPLPADAPLGDWADLAASVAMPIAAGENITGADRFRDTVRQAGLTYLQPDICKWGGLSVIAEVAREAEQAGLTYCPHFLGGGVGLLASAHLLSAIGGEGWVEVDSSENPLLDVFSAGHMTLVDGAFHLPDVPGLGPVPDVAAVADLKVSHREVRL